MSKSAIVIGGGIMGLSAAYYLHKAGYRVRVLDQGDLRSGASWVNAGYLTPSHIISLANPALLKQGLKWMLKSDSPFYIQPRADLDFLKWAWYFKKSSTAEKVGKAIPVIRDINVLSKQLYEDMLASGDLGDFQLDKRGLLMLFKTEKAGDKEKAVAEKAHDLGLEVNILDHNQLRSLEPGVMEDVAGAVHYECDAHTTPNEIMEALMTYLEREGVKLNSHEPVTGFEHTHKHISAVHTTKDTYTADVFILAAGSWSGKLVKQLGLSMPLQPGKGYRINVFRPTGIRYPAVLMEAKVAVTPMKGFTRFAGTMEFSGHNHKIRPERVAAIASASKAYYKGLDFTTEELEGAACGLRPVSPDGLPYIGRLGKFENLLVSAGHAMMGWSLGPASGKLITEILEDQPLSMQIQPFNPLRKF